MSTRRTPLLLFVALSACGFPKPPPLDDLGDAGADGPIDAELPPGLSIRVSNGGDDANDGRTAPVKTLKHAIGLAAANPDITSIVLATGRYAAVDGETFPYAIPPNLTLLGPAGGGAILAGSKTEPGLTVAAGTLRDLELEDFTVAVTATGTSHLVALRIRTDMTALRAETSARLTADNVDIAGATGKCALGIELHGAAELTANVLTTRGLRTTVDARDQSVVRLAQANLVGDTSCNSPRTGVLTVSTAKTVTVTDSLLDGGDVGVYFVSADVDTPATIKNTTIRNMKETGITGSKLKLDVTGGEISANANAFGMNTGNATFTGVTMKQNHAFVVELGVGAVVFRRCSFLSNGGGVYLFATTVVDAGTAESPGGNVFQNGTNTVGIDIDGGARDVHVNAVGNTWRPSVQGADAQGHYSSMTINGPVGYSGQNNFNVPTASTLQL